MFEEATLQKESTFREVRFLMTRNETLSEREVIERVKKGNKEAYQLIVVRYMKRAYYIALGFVHNHEDALDISQESFIRAFRKIRGFNTQKPFFPWFYKLMRNLCLDHLKRSSRIQEIPFEETQIMKEEREDRELKETLWRGIESLSLEQREVIILRYFQQMSYQEIAEITEKPVGTIMSSLYYAKKKLREIMGKFLAMNKDVRR